MQGGVGFFGVGEAGVVGAGNDPEGRGAELSEAARPAGWCETIMFARDDQRRHRQLDDELFGLIGKCREEEAHQRQAAAGQVGRAGGWQLGRGLAWDGPQETPQQRGNGAGIRVEGGSRQNYSYHPVRHKQGGSEDRLGAGGVAEEDHIMPVGLLKPACRTDPDTIQSWGAADSSATFPAG